MSEKLDTVLQSFQQQDSSAQTHAHDSKAKEKEQRLHSYNSLINALSKKGNTQDVLLIYQRMKGEGISPNLLTLNALVGSLSSSNRLDESILLMFDIRRDYNVKPDVQTFNKLIDHCSQKGLLCTVSPSSKNALSMLFSIHLLMLVVLLTGFIFRIMQIFGWMRQDGVQPNAATYNSIIRAYTKKVQTFSTPFILTFFTVCMGSLVVVSSHTIHLSHPITRTQTLSKHTYYYSPITLHTTTTTTHTQSSHA